MFLIHFCLFACFVWFWGGLRFFCISVLVKQRHDLVFSRAVFDQTLPESFTTPPSPCTSQNYAIFRKHFLKPHVFANMGSLSPALPLWLLLIVQGVSADAGKHILSQVSFPPSHVLIICSGGCRKQAKSTQAKGICCTLVKLLQGHQAISTSTQAQHTSEPGACKKCQAPVPIMFWLCSWPISPLLEAQAPRPRGSGGLLLPDLPLADLVPCLKDALSSFMRLPPSLHKFPIKEVYITDSCSSWSGLGNV